MNGCLCLGEMASHDLVIGCPAPAATVAPGGRPERRQADELRAGPGDLAARLQAVQALQNGYSDPDACPVDLRGVTFTFGYVAIKRLGAGQFYLVSIRDADGSALDGSQTYRLTVPSDAPVEQYW